MGSETAVVRSTHRRQASELPVAGGRHLEEPVLCLVRGGATPAAAHVSKLALSFEERTQLVTVDKRHGSAGPVCT